MNPPELSVIIPTFNRLDRIKRVLDALARQDYSRGAFEVIVVSDGSTDGTNAYLEALSSYPVRLRSVFQSNQGPAAARNKGVLIAEGEFIVFLDDDVVPEQNCLTEHVLAHRLASGIVAVIGPLSTPKDIKLLPWVGWEQQMLEKQYNAMIMGCWQPTARQFYTGNASIRRDVFQATGGFDVKFRRAEDVELAYRLADRGVGFVFTMSAAGTHYAERSFNSWQETAYAYGKNDAIFARERKQEWLLTVIRTEFGHRRLPLQLLIKACLGRPQLSNLIKSGLRKVAGISGRLAVSPIERAAYSCLFGLRYYEGFLDEIGQLNFFSQ